MIQFWNWGTENENAENMGFCRATFGCYHIRVISFEILDRIEIQNACRVRLRPKMPC